MLNKQRFFTLILTALMLVMFISQSAFALKVTVSNSSHTLSDYSENNGTYQSAGGAIYLNGNDSFSIVFSATDVQGIVDWNLTDYFDIPQGYDGTERPPQLSEVQFTPSGNIATLTGTLNSSSPELAIVISAIDRDSNGNMIHDSSSSLFMFQLTCFNQDYFSSNGNEINPAPTNPEEEAVNMQPQKTKELHVGIIEAVQLDDDVMQKLADNIGVDKGELHLLTNEDFTTATPPEPTQSMRDQVASDGYEFAAKLNTINVKEDGYYVFKVTVSDDLVGVNVSDLKLYYAEDSDFTTSAINSVKLAFGLMPIINGVTGGLEVSNFLGVKLDTVPKQFLATMFLSASKSITVYIVRILLLLLGGCNVGIGIAEALIVGFVTVKFFKKRK